MDDDTCAQSPAHHGFTAEQMWRDEIRLGGVQRCPLSTQSPFPFFPSHPPPPLLGLSFELHVAWLPTASRDKPSCPLTTSFLMLAGECRGLVANVCTRAQTCTSAHTSHTGFSGTSSKKKSFQMTKHRLLDECLLRLFFVFSPSPSQKSIIVSLFIFHSLSFFSFFVLIFVFLSFLAVGLLSLRRTAMSSFHIFCTHVLPPVLLCFL